MLEDELSESDESVPNEFLCPIYQEIMKDPVITEDGFTFERRGIEDWFKKGKKTNPLTNKVLPGTMLIENRALRNVILHHRERVKNIELVATQNAEALIKNANESIKEEFPELIDEFGYVKLDKIYEVYKNYTEIHSFSKQILKDFNVVKSKVNKNCQECKELTDEIRKMYKFLKSKAEMIRKCPDFSEKIEKIKIDNVNFITFCNKTAKDIDFKKIKKTQFVLDSLNGIKLNELTLYEIERKIKEKYKNQIEKDENFRFWKCGVEIGQFYEHILKETENVTGLYIGRIKGLGEKLENTGTKLKDINLKNGEYLVVEHYKNDEYVFRDTVTKCDFCYKKKEMHSQCPCGKVNYCSKECEEKDLFYHRKVCKNYEDQHHKQ